MKQIYACTVTYDFVLCVLKDSAISTHLNLDNQDMILSNSDVKQIYDIIVLPLINQMTFIRVERK